MKIAQEIRAGNVIMHSTQPPTALLARAAASPPKTPS